MSLPRFRIRTLMIAVAVTAALTAVLIWGLRMREVRALRLMRAAWHSGQVIEFKNKTIIMRAIKARLKIPHFSDLEDRWVIYHEQLERKYIDTARRPWLAVPPDPPPPE